MVKILLVEEDAQLRLGLRMRLALEADFIIAGETGKHAEAIQLAGAIQPDVIILDLQMPGMNIPESVRQSRQAAPGCKIVILTLHDDPAFRQQAREAGVAAIVSKREPDTSLIDAIHTVTGQANRSSELATEP
jgi:DNA-binding NarL/FixJ family response regulator